MRMVKFFALLTLALSLAALPCLAAAPAKKAAVPASLPVHSLKDFAAAGYFYVGGKYVGEGGKQGMHGQMYVEVFVPRKVTQPYPLVMYHGAAQTGTNWLGTPDGRKGWMHYFVEKGYIVYVVDQPARGRSNYLPGVDGQVRIMSAPQIQNRFTDSAAAEQPAAWPQAKKQTQWPGSGPKKGQIGDPVFDAFYATQVSYLSSNKESQQLVRDASNALLDKIGPAVLVTHSQSGAFGWAIADSRPNLVKGIVALEPSGPPFENAVFGSEKSRAWGITDVPMTYDPPVKDPSELQTEPQASQKPGEVAGVLQKAPARQLVNLKGIPIIILAGEASYHVAYDEWTSRFLTQAGVKNDFVPLAEQGLKGNGHMLMIEKNSLDIAALVDKWLRKNVR